MYVKSHIFEDLNTLCPYYEEFSVLLKFIFHRFLLDAKLIVYPV